MFQYFVEGTSGIKPLVYEASPMSICPLVSLGDGVSLVCHIERSSLDPDEVSGRVRIYIPGRWERVSAETLRFGYYQCQDGLDSDYRRDRAVYFQGSGPSEHYFEHFDTEQTVDLRVSEKEGELHVDDVLVQGIPLPRGGPVAISRPSGHYCQDWSLFALARGITFRANSWAPSGQPPTRVMGRQEEP